MRHIVAVFLLCGLIAVSDAGGWTPQWAMIQLPDTEALAYFGEDQSPEINGRRVVWVFLVHPKPKPAKYSPGKEFVAEVQEWVVNCKAGQGSVATIRYTNETDPDKLHAALLVHPLGKERPTTEQVQVLCEQLI